MPDTAEAWAREIVAQWLDHGADMLSSGPHERPVITEGLVTLIASAITASAEAMQERAARAADDTPRHARDYVRDDYRNIVEATGYRIASAIRALPLSSDEHEKEQP